MPGLTKLPPWAVGLDGISSPKPKCSSSSLQKKPPTAPAGGFDAASSSYERKLESSKRKLEKGYAAHEGAKKHLKVIEFNLGPAKKGPKADGEEEEELLLPTGSTKKQRRWLAAFMDDDEERPPGKPMPPKWYLRLKKEREEARIRSLVHAEIREQQRRGRSQL